MGSHIVLDKVEFSSVTANAATTWSYAEVVDRNGTRALAECGVGPKSDDVIALISELVDRLAGKSLNDEADVVHEAGVDAAQLRPLTPTSVAVSAVRSAVAVLQATQNGVSLTEALGGTLQDSVELYANINRALLGQDRSPESFAKEAEGAAEHGFRTIKCAPFDEVERSVPDEAVPEAAKAGIARVSAVRAAIGPDVRLLVDCHTRFGLRTALPLAEELAKLDVGWFEEPLDRAASLEDMAAITGQTPMPVAGGESGYGAGFFDDLLNSKAVHIIMPDVMLCGGVAEARRAGQMAAEFGGGFSLHSPSGPVALLSSAHVTAATPGAMALEHAVNEASWRQELLDPPERVEGGRLWFPGGPGLGATLNRATVDRHGRRWSP